MSRCVEVLVSGEGPVVFFGADGGCIVGSDEGLFGVAMVSKGGDWVAGTWRFGAKLGWRD